jgi:glycosyltransferase involved in cell wall biosynthesis
MMAVSENLTVHCVVRNEERWIWFALHAALPFCERLMLWDTGSTDETLEIMRCIDSPKIVFRECGPVDAESLTDLRNEMIQETRTDWIAIVDGDEIWPPAAWLEIAHQRRDKEAEVIVIPFLYPFPRLGFFSATNDDDFYIAGMTGSYSAKVFRRAKNIHWHGSYGSEQIRLEGGAGIILACA